MTNKEFDSAVALLKNKESYNFADLCLIVELLRHERGCPWDREQTHKSIRKNMLEEAYEAAEAIDLEDSALLCEELGDVMLQTVLHASISASGGGFGVNDVCTGICSKLIVRHPHVFGDVSVSGTADVLKNWENIKQANKGVKTATGSIEGISKALPSLVRAQKIGQKAAKQRFDFASAEAALEKAGEEVAELKAALAAGDSRNAEEEVGDLLLAVVNTARLAGIDAEEALHKANEKFCKRFAMVEGAANAEGKQLCEKTEEEMLALWNKAKTAI